MDAPATETYATNDFVTTWRNVVQDPAGFFATMPETGGLGAPLRFVVLCAAINAAGTFLVSGRKIPRDGGIILAVGDSREQIEAIAREDPFHARGLADVRVVEFRASQRSDAFQKLIGE